MNNEILTIIIGICALVIGILAFGDEIGKIKGFKFFKSIFFKIVILLIASIIGTWSSLEKDSNSEQQLLQEKQNAQIEQKKRDSSNRVYIEENNRKFLKTYTDALIQFGLKYDSTKNEIARIVKDSTHKIVNYNYGPDPSISILPKKGIKMTKNSTGDRLILTFKCSNASCKNINIKVFCCIWEFKDSVNYIYHKSDLKFLFVDQGLTINFVMEKDDTADMPYDTHTNASPDAIYYVLIKGTYSNSDNTKVFPINDLYSFSADGKNFGITPDPANTIIRNFINKNIEI